ncbi:MAG: DUF721 domain-containing protein [Reyranellaceae bacterium]
MNEPENVRRGQLRSVGAALPKITGKYAGKRAPLAQLRAVWPDIAGRDVGDQSLPEKLLGLPRGKQETERAATLRIRCSGVAALELQHRQSELVDRINAFFGYRAIDRIVLSQGPLPARKSHRQPAPPLDQRTRQAMEREVETVADGDLRAALKRLAAAIAKGG